MATCAARVAGWRCSSGSVMRCATGIGCWRWCGVRRSTRTAGPTGRRCPTRRRSRRCCAPAYANAGVRAADIDYVEAHGTGTALGDPIEARALGTVWGVHGRRALPLLIGSVKTNLGHLEAAAGIAGFIKTVLSVQRGHIPAHLNFENPNPHIPFEDLRLKVVAEPTAGRRRSVRGEPGCRRSVSVAPMRMWCWSRLRICPNPVAADGAGR